MGERWVIWMYALRPGWENTGGEDSRDAARAIRQDLIDEGYPPEFVSIRRESQGAPRRRPPLEAIRMAQRQVAQEMAQEMAQP